MKQFQYVLYVYLLQTASIVKQEDGGRGNELRGARSSRGYEPAPSTLGNGAAMTDWSHIIVGGGASGCVIAGRLTENSRFRVLLLEAGSDYLPGHEPDAVRQPYPVFSDPRYMWNLIAEVGADPGTGAPPLSRAYAQGRMIGGSSSVNGMSAQRGLPDDYDDWERAGATGWGWRDVLPFFRKLESDQQFNGPLHGHGGPIPLRRYRREQWPPYVRAVATEMEQRGFPFEPDLSATSADCVTRMALNNTEESRVSTAMAYLTAEVRRRPNLSIRGDAHVERLIADSGRIVGVRLDSGEELRGRETILSAGGIQSPLLLLRSGIGPAGDLQRLGIQVIANRPGVGQGVRNHAAVHLATHLPRRSVQPDDLRSWGFALLRYSSGREGCGAGDMQIFPTNRAAKHPLGRRIGTLSVNLYQPKAEGTIRLKSTPDGPAADVRFNTLGHPDDLARMVEGVGLAAQLLAAPAVAKVRNDVFVPNGGQANALNQPGIINLLKSWIIVRLFDGPGWFRKALLGHGVVDPARLASDAGLRERIVRATAASVHHVSCSCRMGRQEDLTAVVDHRARVIGLEGLRVADLSICPTIVRGGPHLTAIMIGEKVAQMISEDAASSIDMS